MATLVAIVVFPIFRRLILAIKARPQSRLLFPVVIYAVTITIMVISALLTLLRPDWQRLPAALVSLGAVTIFITRPLGMGLMNLFQARMASEAKKETAPRLTSAAGSLCQSGRSRVSRAEITMMVMVTA